MEANGVINMKKETLEEVALEFAKRNCEMYETSNYGSMHLGFCWGAKWQQEKICDSEVIQRIRATKSDAEARRIIRKI